MRRDAGNRTGFTLIELLLVLTIIGLSAALIIPRAMRAQTDTKYGQVRQYGSEIASYIMAWAQNQARAQRTTTSFTLKDFLYQDIIEADGAGVISNKLADKYTGHDDFKGVANLVAADKMPTNPFNEASYFSQVNNDQQVPSPKPGLLYLAAQPDPSQEEYLNFYLLFTSTTPDDSGSFWYGGMDPNDRDKVRRGVFVARLYNDEEPGTGEGPFLMGGESQIPRPPETPPGQPSPQSQ